MGIIYCYTNLINGKKYVGQTINPEKRYNQHKSSAFNEKDKDYNTPLHRAFRKYGYDNFKRTTIKIFDTEEEAYNFEKLVVTPTLLKSKQCYNTTIGGIGGGNEM